MDRTGLRVSALVLILLVGLFMPARAAEPGRPGPEVVALLGGEAGLALGAEPGVGGETVLAGVGVSVPAGGELAIWTEEQFTVTRVQGSAFRAALRLAGGRTHQVFLGYADGGAGEYRSFARALVRVEAGAAAAPPEPKGEPVRILRDWATVSEPGFSGAGVEDRVRVSGRVSGEFGGSGTGARHLVASTVRATADGQVVSTQVIPVGPDGGFAAEVWLRFGPGEYIVWLSRPGRDGQMEPGARFTVRNRSERDLRDLAPAGPVRSDAPEVRELAARLTAGLAAEREQARAIAEWVHATMRYDPAHGGGDAVQLLAERRGLCGDYANLTIALLRSVQIPARFAYGPAHNGTGWIPHAWVEALVDGRWLTIDPTWGLFDPDPDLLAASHRLEGYGT